MSQITDPLDRVRIRGRLPDPARRKAIREAADLSTHDMAKLLGVTSPSISNWERGSTPSVHTLGPYVELLESLAAALTNDSAVDTEPSRAAS